MITITELAVLKDRLRALIRDELSLSRFKEVDGDYRFRYEGMNVSCIFDEHDPSFVWLVLFSIHWVKGPDAAGLAAIDRAMSDVNYKVKAVKLTRDIEPDKDGDYAVHASVSFVAEDVQSQSWLALERYLGQLKAGANLFRDLVAKERPNSEDVPVGAVRH